MATLRAPIAVWTVLVTCMAGAAAAASAGRLHGVVADESGGVLPGVTVTITALDRHVLATTSTDGRGTWAVDGLPAEPATVSFELEGFATSAVDVTVAPGADTAVGTPRLKVAPRSESVNVVARAPVVTAPLPPRPTLPPPPPPPAIVPVPEHDRDSICGPAKPTEGAVLLGTITSRRYGEDKGLYAKDDQVIVAGGAASGLAVGQNVVARRMYRVDGAAGAATGEHTAGVLQIVAAGERASIAVVVYTCDEIMRGDRLAPFAPEPIRPAGAAGSPAFDSAARILFGDAGQLVGAPRRLMVINRGRSEGVRAGQRLTLFRRSRFGGGAPIVVGEAVVVAVRADSATIRVERATDAIAFGDYAAPQLPDGFVASSDGGSPSRRR